MVELFGTLSNLEAPVRWRELAPEHRKLLGRVAAEPAAPMPARRAQPALRLWPEIAKLLAGSPNPLTPRQIELALVRELGVQVPASSVKSCLLRNVSADGPLQRVGPGQYVFMGSPEAEAARSEQALRVVQLWPHIAGVLGATTKPLSPARVQRLLEQQGHSFPLFRVNDSLMRHVTPKGPLIRDDVGRYVLPTQAKDDRATSRRRRRL